MHSQDRLRLAVCATVLVLAGCQSASPRGTHPSDAPGGTPPVGAAKTVTASDADNGHAIDVAKGDRVVVTLHSTYWQLAPLTPGVALHADGPASVVVSHARGCMPGQGCGTVTESFRAVTLGSTVITAHRTSCGEALRCTTAKGSYRITIVVG